MEFYWHIPDKTICGIKQAFEKSSSKMADEWGEFFVWDFKDKMGEIPLVHSY